MLSSQDHFHSPIISISFPKKGKFRSRTVVSRSRARSTGKYPSWKMGRMIQFESVNELNAYRLLDADPSVIEYHEQPLAINFVQDETPHIHYPDTLVKWKNYQELWEIKSPRYTEKQDYIQRTQLLESALKEFGYNYRMINADSFRRQPRLNNSITLLKFGRHPVCPLLEEKLRLIIEVEGCICWGAILKGCMGKEGRQLVCRLFLEGRLHFDIEKKLAPKTEFRWVEDNNKVSAWSY